MIIIGKRKRKLDKQLYHLREGTPVLLGVPVSMDIQDTLSEIGFNSLDEGETVLPSPVFGPVCRYNAEGKEIVHRDQPMETAYRQVEWTWEQWAGRYDTETMSKIVDVPYKRYPRTFDPPPSIELSIAVNGQGAKYVVCKIQTLDYSHPEALLHCINVFLEIFNQCQVLTNVSGCVKMP